MFINFYFIYLKKHVYSCFNSQILLTSYFFAPKYLFHRTPIVSVYSFAIFGCK